MKTQTRWLGIVLILLIFSVWVSLPDTTGFMWDSDGDAINDTGIAVRQSLGLDIVGGLRVLLQAELPDGSYTQEDLQQTANNVARRVNSLGVSEPTIQVQGSNRVLVELPGISDREAAIKAIQQTALLEFVDFSGMASLIDGLTGQSVLTTQQDEINRARNIAPDPSARVNPQTGQPFETVMTGSGLQSAVAQVSQDGRGWIIVFETTTDGAQVFGPFTGSHIGQPLAIVLDGVLLSAPTIQDRLDTGGVISGGFDEEAARTLALQLRSGALPIPLRVESAETVGATLGQESVNLSIRAGFLGVVVIFLFMTIYYRVPGIAATLALIAFILFNYAVFKLIPVTLTLPAITGFLISIGTAVDGNILIFERIKEELRSGKTLDDALEAGFHRAWQSIRDSNVSTIIICAILFFFGQTPGASIVAGFAVTLMIGLVINLFTAVLVTRAFLSVFIALLRQPLQQRSWLLGV
ncbi:MAG: protein translocase subunit SecD [Anaerolineae bacterium]|nr:protein translocase subunit SecD [Anaerolineae bacterium]NUQ02766.1 protein translocase subunit SecD [Anaerolineae bacterium]